MLRMPEIHICKIERNRKMYKHISLRMKNEIDHNFKIFSEILRYTL